jgi:mRNA-degrading endonuclease RelE of RelBE toxin-antitoxin system
MKIDYKRPFAQFVKKVSKPLQLVIEDKVLEVCKRPDLGERKTGDLREIWVYKFRFNKQEYLMAYRLGKCNKGIDLIWISFYQIGSHENFYSGLKRFLQQEPVLEIAKGGEK